MNSRQPRKSPAAPVRRWGREPVPSNGNCRGGAGWQVPNPAINGRADWRSTRGQGAWRQHLHPQPEGGMPQAPRQERGEEMNEKVLRDYAQLLHDVPSIWMDIHSDFYMHIMQNVVYPSEVEAAVALCRCKALEWAVRKAKKDLRDEKTWEALTTWLQCYVSDDLRLMSICRAIEKASEVAA